jgi:hypothetical protein
MLGRCQVYKVAVVSTPFCSKTERDWGGNPCRIPVGVEAPAVVQPYG